LHTEIDGKIIREYITSEEGNYNDYYNSLYDSIRLDKPLPVTPEEGAEVVKIIETAFESSKKQSVIHT
jgi:scyllo-inositol 2-dehydrogenase (NADP+)